MGAESRLLPPAIPFRFFLAAAGFHVAAWIMLASAADQVPSFIGGPGPVLAAAHALTLGVLTMTAMGASFQILPVVSGQSLMATWPCSAAFWLYLCGVVVLLHGFSGGDYLPSAGGAAMVVLALAAYAILIADILRRTRGMRFLVLYGWTSLASLLGLAGLGLLLILDMEQGFLEARADIALTHFILAAYGFMGMLAVGYSHVLVPMFALSEAPDEGHGNILFILSLAALLLGAGGAAAGCPVSPILGAAIGLGAAALYVWMMNRALARGMRKNLGLSFVLVRTAWAFLVVGLVVGAFAGMGLAGETGPALFAFTVLFGWLLTFLLGVLQRIIPFLAVMIASKEGRTPPRPSELASEAPLKIHAVCHFAALAAVTLGIVIDRGGIVLAGALTGLAGSLAYLWFALGVYWRMRVFIQSGGSTA